MPILIDNVNFTDAFGNNTTFYKANAGDEVTAVFSIRSQQRLSSVGNPLTLDATLNQVTSTSVSWLDEGFRPGQNVLVRINASGGALINQFWTTVTYCDDVLADFTAMPDWYDITTNESIQFFPVIANGSQTVIPRDDMDVLFNNPKNSASGSEFSLIDGETTRFLLPGLAALTVGGVVNGTEIINQSGAFIKSVSIEKIPNAGDGWFQHELTVVFANPGQYDDGSWFFSSECLKAYLKIEWALVAGEPYAKAQGIYDLQANTGGFDEPFNTLPVDSVLIGGVNEIDYFTPTTFDIIVDGPVVQLGVGASYQSIDATYYKNQPQSQYNLAMLIPTSPAVVGTITSEQNPTGADYDLTINSVNTIGSTTTINVTFTPSAAFSAFMDARDDGDRRFNVWVKCGNINWLVFADQLSADPPVGGPLVMEQDFGYLTHAENVTDITGNLTGFVADTEDDVAYIGRFLLDKNQVYESFSVKIEAFNPTTGADFTLQIATFSFSGVPISGAGVYLLNETAGTVSTLPNTSEKLNAFLVLDPTLDTPTQYGVKIYCPWLLNWKYWLPQANASVDFYPTQNKNWEQYDNVGDWIIQTELALIKEGLAFTHTNRIIIRDYDAEEFVISQIDLIDDASSNVVGVVAEGNLMRIRSTHINTAEPWDVSTLWGMLTIEPYENGPRWICSTAVNFDNNTNNPLTPLSGLLIVPNFTAADTVELECYFDTNKIDLFNGVKITAKIYSGRKGPGEGDKTTAPNDLAKTDHNAINKTLAP